MRKDFDDIYRKMDQSHKDITIIDKNQDKIIKEISDLKKEIKNIVFKVDAILEILNSFTIMLAEDNEYEDEDSYASEEEDDESWVPEQEENWNSYEDDEDESI